MLVQCSIVILGIASRLWLSRSRYGRMSRPSLENRATLVRPVQADHRVRHGNANAGEELIESVTGFRGQGSAGMFGMCYAPTEVMPRRGRNGDGAADFWKGDNATS